MKALLYHLTLIIIVSCCVPVAFGEQSEDSDKDGLSDLDEARIYRTDPQLPDTDTDGLTDGQEINQYWTLPLVSDSDGDGFLDGIEVRLNSDPNEASSKPDPQSAKFKDLDGDGVPNTEEKDYGTDPQRIDSDFDGLLDGWELDSENIPMGMVCGTGKKS